MTDVVTYICPICKIKSYGRHMIFNFYEIDDPQCGHVHDGFIWMSHNESE